jgi:single-stranded-DNA-specific exonuclease
MEQLDVVKEVESGFKFRWIYEKVDVESFVFYSYKYNLPIKIIEILVKRGIKNEEELKTFIEAPLNKFINPFEMKDIELAVHRIYNALNSGEKICIYGDYDVDGITATSIIYIFLKEIGANVIYHIPNGISEGYSLNKNIIRKLAEENVSLIITVDCGINSYNEVLLAKSIGIDVIITDHHMPKYPELSEAVAVINPYRTDESYPFKDLSGVGVVYKLLIALRYYLDKKNFFTKTKKIPNILKYLDLVALGTIGDVSPLIGENRIIVKHGLAMISSNAERVGIKELKAMLGLYGKKICVSDISFIINPRINAAARIGNGAKGVRLFATNSEIEARKLIEDLNAENRSRRHIERRIVKEIQHMIEENRMDLKYKALVLYSHSWHPSIVSVIASKVVEQYNRPVIVIAFNGKIGKGSARSQSSFNLYKSIKHISRLLYDFGGHKNAVGLRVSFDNISDLQREFNKYVASNLSSEEFTPAINIDAILEPEDINDEMFDSIKLLEPFGEKNPNPLFLMKNVKVVEPFRFSGRNGETLKGIIEKNGKAFEIVGNKMFEYKSMLKNVKTLDIIFNLERNYWSNENFLLKIKDLKKNS